MAYSYVYRLSKVEGCPWCRVVKMINIGVDAENTSGHVSGCVEKTQTYNTHAHLICPNCDAQFIKQQKLNEFKVFISKPFDQCLNNHPWIPRLQNTCVNGMTL